MKSLSFPPTATCRVVYVKGGVTYAGIMPTPKTQVELLRAMSARQATVDSVQRIEPVAPRPDQIRSHPAQHRMVQYASMAEK